MPVQLDAASKNLPIFNPQDKVEFANTELHKLSSHIATRANGAKWPGYLKLVSDPNSNTMSVERNRWFSGKSKPTAEDNQATSAYIKDLFRVSYGSRCSPAQYDKIMQEVENYLDNNNNKLGSRHFLSFVRAFDAAVDQLKTGNQPVYSANPLPQEVSGLLASTKDKHGVPPEMVEQDHKSGLQQLFGVDSGNVKLLGSGAEGSAYSIWADGKSVVYKAFAREQPITLDSLRHGEIGAARLKNAPNVSTPADLMVRRNDGTTYRVPANEIKSFARQQLSQPDTSLQLIGTVMPRAVGKPVDTLIAKNPLNDRDFSAFSKGLYDGLQQMHNRRAVHHDVKPANVLFDPQTGATTLIDMGGVDKLSKKEDGPQKSSRFIGTQFFYHPKFEPVGMKGREYVANQHSTEVDRYAFGLTLLMSLDSTFNSNEFSTFAMSRVIPPDTPASRYLEENLNLLRQFSQEGADRLEQRLAQNPDVKKLLEDSFAASEGGPEADALWQGIRNNPMFVAIDTERAQAKQNFVQQKANLTNPALIPEGNNSESVLSPVNAEVRQGKFLPEQGLFRAGQQARLDVANKLQADINNISAAANEGSRSSWVLLTNFDNDKDWEQLRKDIIRADYRVNDVSIEEGSAVDRMKALKGSLDNMIQGQDVDPEQQTEFNNKVFNELAGLLHQGTTLTTFGGSAIGYLNGSAETKKPWHGALFDHPNFNIKPDTEQAGALLIEVSGSQKAGVVFYNNAQFFTGKSEESLYDFEENMNIQLRYTPNRDMTQPGTIEVLDVRAQFALKAD